MTRDELPEDSPFRNPVVLADVAAVFRRARARRLAREAAEREQRQERAS